MALERIGEGASEHAALLAGIEDYLRQKGKGVFAPSAPITAARAPARIDCMGGIADYSGSLVFEGTLGRAAVVALQPREDQVLRVRSTLLEEQGDLCEVQVTWDDLRRGAEPVSYEDARGALTADADSAWAAYVLGALYVLDREGVCRMEHGANLLLWSDIPAGVGVGSSAALEVAAMCAGARACGVELEGTRLAALAQMVENRVVGAPCGIMDQLTSALGEAGKLLAIRCRPAEVVGFCQLPPQVRLFGISSRVAHSVGGSAYTAARVSAFMGLKIILNFRQEAGEEIQEKDYYLCNISPETYCRRYRSLLPDTMKGTEFLAAYGETTDPVTSVDPDTTYPVRSGAEHPIYENRRVEQFIQCVERAGADDRTALVEAGGLMYASHHSYGWNCGLGCRETDLIVDMVRRRGPEEGFYGAKITGGGSGGTVAILADRDVAGAVRGIAEEYQEATGIAADLFDDTSPGACAFGQWSYVIR